jgi:hypothetical protein
LKKQSITTHFLGQFLLLFPAKIHADFLANETKIYIYGIIRIIGDVDIQLSVSRIDEFSRTKSIISVYIRLFCRKNKHLRRIV